jgi:hypothetical protein
MMSSKQNFCELRRKYVHQNIDWRFRMLKRFIFVILVFMLMGACPPDGSVGFRQDDVVEAIMALHTGDHFVWWECGKGLTKAQGEKRAQEYAEEIQWGVSEICRTTGEWVNPDHVAAVLYRESSNNECVIGRQETNKLKDQLGRAPRRSDFIGHVRRWSQARDEAYAWCKKNDKKSGCVDEYLWKHYPEYRNINGWDIGAAQYRWPGWGLRERSVTLRNGETISPITIQSLLDYRVGTRLLIEDMASHKVSCRRHKHYQVSRWGRRMGVIPTEDAYYVHHHTGAHRWSHKYWKRVRKHLAVIGKVKESSFVARLTSHPLRMFNPLFF